MTVLSILIILDFGYKSIIIINIFQDFFKPIYGILYLVFTLPLLVALFLASYYLCCGGKKIVGLWALALAAISNLLIAVWVSIYFFSIETRDEVRYHWGTLDDIAGRQDPDDKDYFY